MRVYLYIKFGWGNVFRTLWFCPIAPKWFQQVVSASHGCKSHVTLRLKSTIVIFKMISLPFSLILLPCRFFTTAYNMWEKGFPLTSILQYLRFCPYTGEYGSVKTRILAYFTQCTWFSYTVQIWKVMTVWYTFLLRKYLILTSAEWNVLPIQLGFFVSYMACRRILKPHVAFVHMVLPLV